MEHLIGKFLKMMELRSVRFLHRVEEITKQYQAEHDTYPDIIAKPHQFQIADLTCDFYDDVRIDHYKKNGVGHRVLEIVNSNFNRVADMLNELLVAYNAPGTRRNLIEDNLKQLDNFLGLPGFNPPRLLTDDEFIDASKVALEEILNSTSEMMKDPMDFYSGATCVTMSGMVGIKDYLKKLKEEDQIPMWDEVDFAEFFFPRFSLSDK